MFGSPKGFHDCACVDDVVVHCAFVVDWSVGLWVGRLRACFRIVAALRTRLLQPWERKAQPKWRTEKPMSAILNNRAIGFTHLYHLMYNTLHEFIYILYQNQFAWLSFQCIVYVANSHHLINIECRWPTNASSHIQWKSHSGTPTIPKEYTSNVWHMSDSQSCCELIIRLVCADSTVTFELGSSSVSAPSTQAHRQISIWHAEVSIRRQSSSHKWMRESIHTSKCVNHKSGCQTIKIVRIQ